MAGAPAVVNHYCGGGCWNFGAAAIAGAAIGAAAVGLALGSLVATVPSGCPYHRSVTSGRARKMAFGICIWAGAGIEEIHAQLRQSH
jgi:hypothetical protein